MRCRKSYFFLSNKRAMEDKDNFGNVAEIDDHIEEFIFKINKAKTGL